MEQARNELPSLEVKIWLLPEIGTGRNTRAEPCCCTNSVHMYLHRELRETGKEQKMKTQSLLSCKVMLFSKILLSRGNEQVCTPPSQSRVLCTLRWTYHSLGAEGMKLLMMFTCLTGQLRADDLWV